MAGNESNDLGRLEREAERSRADLSQTVDEIRARLSESTRELKERVSPDHIKSDVKNYVHQASENFVGGLERRVRDNPLQALAIGAGLAYPLFKIVRSIPAPILLIGAGFALAKPPGQPGYGAGALRAAGSAFDDFGNAAGRSRDEMRGGGTFAGRTHNAMGSATNPASSMADAAARSGAALRDKAGDLADRAQDAMASAGDRASAMADAAAQSGDALRNKAGELAGRAQDAMASASDRAAALADAARNSVQSGAASLQSRANDLQSQAAEQASRAANVVSDLAARASDMAASSYQTGAETLRQGWEQTAQMSQRARNTAYDVVQENPLILAGVGVAIGAAIAAALPVTKVESRVLGPAGEALKAQANDLASKGVDRARELAGRAYDQVLDKAQEQGLTPDGVRHSIQEIGDKVRGVAEHAVAAAGLPSGEAQKTGEDTPKPQNT